MPAQTYIAPECFMGLDIRIGKIVEVDELQFVRKPSYQVLVDFGAEIGARSSILGAKGEYSRNDLIGRFVVAVVNLQPKSIAGVISEVLILGAPAADDKLCLLQPDRPAKLGGKVY